MEKIFVDTNIFIRALTNDIASKASQCTELFIKAQNGEITLYTTNFIIAEIIYVCTSSKTYKISRNEIYNLLLPYLILENLKIEDKAVVLQGLQLYSDTNLDFEDCLLAAIAQAENNYQSAKIYSYDKGFDKLDGINRLEP